MARESPPHEQGLPLPILTVIAAFCPNTGLQGVNLQVHVMAGLQKEPQASCPMPTLLEKKLPNFPLRGKSVFPLLGSGLAL